MIHNLSHDQDTTDLHKAITAMVAEAAAAKDDHVHATAGDKGDGSGDGGRLLAGECQLSATQPIGGGSGSGGGGSSVGDQGSGFERRWLRQHRCGLLSPPTFLPRERAAPTRISPRLHCSITVHVLDGPKNVTTTICAIS